MSGFDMAVARLRRELREKDPDVFCARPTIRCGDCSAEIVKGGTTVKLMQCGTCRDLNGPWGQE